MERKRKIIRAIINDLEKATYEDLINSESLKELLVRETPTAIELAIKNRNSFATVFEINNTNEYVEIHRRDWIPALESCITYHANKENYEECSRINSIISDIKAKTTRMTIKTNLDE